MPLKGLAHFVTISLLLLAVDVTGYKWPSPQYDALELTLYEGQSPNGQTPATIASGCGSRVSVGQGGPPIGAEWLRLSYHDMATHNATDGTGGLDASIYYEYNRPENVGAGNFNSLVDFANSPTTLVSLADIIAMAAIWGVTVCGGPPIAYRGGRIDARAPGRFGVPQPQEDLQTHIQEFKLQGFTPTEMISLVACGHTIGGVRNLDFPHIVPSADGQPNATLVGAFDSTIQQYDFNIVSEYLNGTTKDPLVVVSQSDLNIFSSDGNATIQSMNSPTAYIETCKALLQRMLETVPSNVQLTEEIAFLPFKVRRAEVTVLDGTQLVFHVDIRVQFPAGVAQNVTMFWCDRRGPSAGCADGTVNVAAHAPLFFKFPQLSPLSVALGINTTRLDFTIPLTSAGVEKFWFEVGDPSSNNVIVEDNGGDGYQLQDTLIAPHVQFVDAIVPPNDPTDLSIEWMVIAGVLNGTADTVPQVRVTDMSVPFSSLVEGQTPSIPPPINTTLTLTLNNSLPAVEGYTFYTGLLTGQESVMLDFSVKTQGQTFELNFQSVVDGDNEDNTISTFGKQKLPSKI